MFRVINEYLNKIKLKEDQEVFDRLRDFLDNEENIKFYEITVHFKRYIVDIRLEDYSVANAELFFKHFDNAIAYPYSSLHVRFNEGKCVRYRYATCKEDKTGFYCDIVCN